MPINANWYNLQELRRYPLDDSASGVADNGTRLRDNIIVDLALRFPATLGSYVFIGGITVSAGLVTVTFLAADTPTAAANFVPLGAITLPLPIQESRHYDIAPLSPGVGGWVVFGDGITEPFVGRFSTPAQSLVAPRCARSYPLLPIPSLGKLYKNTALSGLVTIAAGSDLAVEQQLVEIGDQLRPAMVISLTQTIANRNTLQVYASPCEPRPESGNCQKPGIQYLNTVGPDCNGNINIYFQGVTAGPYQDCGPGTTLDQSLGLAAVCQGRLPPGDSSLSSIAPPPVVIGSSAAPPQLYSSLSSQIMFCAGLPYCTTFMAGDVASFNVVSGEFALQEIDVIGDSCPAESSGSSLSSAEPPSNLAWTATAGYARNLAAFDDCGYTSSLNKKCVINLQVSDILPDRNGGILINYGTVDPSIPPVVEYFLAMLDHNLSKLRLMRFNGQTLIEEFASGVLPLVLSDWYRITVTTTVVGPGQAAINVLLEGISDPTFASVSFAVTTTRFVDNNGKFGIGSDRGHVRFSYFSLQDLS